MKQSRRVFTTEFKQECVRLIVDQGYGAGEASKAMNVGLSTLQRWLRQYRNEIQGVTPQSRAITPEQQLIQALGGPHAPMEIADSYKTSFRLATLDSHGPTGGFFHELDTLPW